MQKYIDYLAENPFMLTMLILFGVAFAFATACICLGVLGDVLIAFATGQAPDDEDEEDVQPAAQPKPTTNS